MTKSEQAIAVARSRYARGEISHGAYRVIVARAKSMTASKADAGGLADTSNLSFSARFKRIQRILESEGSR